MGITERFRRKCNGSTPQLQHAGLGDKSDIAHRKAGQQAALGGGAARNQPQLRPGGRVGLITPGEFDKIMAKNREKFSPAIAKIMP